MVINHALILSAAIINLTAPVCAKKKKQGPIAPRVMTAWWGLFNKPSECTFKTKTEERNGVNDATCDLNDTFNSFGNGNAIQYSGLYAAGKDSNVALDSSMM